MSTSLCSRSYKWVFFFFHKMLIFFNPQFPGGLEELNPQRTSVFLNSSLWGILLWLGWLQSAAVCLPMLPADTGGHCKSRFIFPALLSLSHQVTNTPSPALPTVALPAPGVRSLFFEFSPGEMAQVTKTEILIVPPEQYRNKCTHFQVVQERN